MNHKRIFPLFILAMCASSCLLQADLSDSVTQENGNVSSKEAPQSYEITLDELSDTPWYGDSGMIDEETGEVRSQEIDFVTVSLEKGQDLVIHIKNVSGVLFDPGAGFLVKKSDQNRRFSRNVGGVYLSKDIFNWGGWKYYWDKKAPLDLVQSQDCKEGVFTFKNRHPGRTCMTFKYTVVPHTIPEGWRYYFSKDSARFNEQEVVVICQ